LVLITCISFLGRASASEETRLTEIKETSGQDQHPPPKGMGDMRLSPLPKITPPPADARPTEVYFPYQSSISARLGMGTDSKKISINEYYHLYGVLYQLPSDTGVHWETGTDVYNDGTGVFSFGRKWRLHKDEAFRPYYKLAVALHADPSEQLTTFLRTENFLIRPSAGFEYFLEHPSSARLELETEISTKLIGFHFCVGYSYAW
jgi:hypothetical protein